MLIYFLTLIAVLCTLFRIRRRKNTVAFFHPYCNAGGGGERVLWCAIKSMQKKISISGWPTLTYVVYSGDCDATKEKILLKAKQRFGIEIDPLNVRFVFLRCRRIVEADLYPRFTLVFQTIAGGFLAFEALCRLCPEVFVDSMGYPFSLPVFKLFGGSRVLAYVHYPTISCDMIDLVERRESTYNNASTIAKSSILSRFKLLYYRIFAFFYYLAGKFSDSTMVNGSWTKGHIDRMWNIKAKIIFPPCDVKSFLDIEPVAEDLFEADKHFKIVSIGQIRPEKDHALQLEVLKRLVDHCKTKQKDIKVSLTIAGGCRNAEDEARVHSLKKLAKQLGIEDHLQWKLNVPFEDLLQLLGESLASIHTMRNEHFGISVVEGMASGTIMVAHGSGGPKMDIIQDFDGEDSKRNGFLATTIEEFAAALSSIASMSAQRRDELRHAARQSSQRFNEEAFADQWIAVLAPFINLLPLTSN